MWFLWWLPQWGEDGEDAGGGGGGPTLGAADLLTERRQLARRRHRLA